MWSPLRLALVLALALPAAGLGKKANAPAAPRPDSPEAQAKQRYTSGMARFNLEDYEGAITEFQAGYLLKPDPLFLFNIAQAHRLAKHPQKGLDFYRRYLRQKPDAENRSLVETTMADLEKQLVAAAQAEKAAVAAPAAPPPRPRPTPQPIVETDTQTGYLSVVDSDGRLYTLIGLGARKYMGFKIYAMGLFLEDEPARAEIGKLVSRAGGSDLGRLTADDLAHNFVLLSDFGKLAELKFVRDVSKGDVQSSYRDSLKQQFPTPAPELAQDIERFVALFDGDVKKGDSCLIRTTGLGEISVEQGGKRQVGPKNPQLAHGIWAIWLGKRPIYGELRKQLVNRIDALAKQP